MRILFLSPRLCVPAFTGARLREFHLVRALGRRAEVTYVSLVGRGAAAPSQDDLPFLKELHLIRSPRRYSPLRLARGLAGRWPLTMVNNDSRQMKALLAELLSRKSFDLIHLDSVSMASYLPYLASRAQARFVFDWHNIVSETVWRFGAATNSAPKRIYARVTARRVEAVERRILRQSFGHIVCSERERAQLLAVEPRSRIEVIENGVETAHFEGYGVEHARRKRIVFAGSMDYYPNAEAAVFFARRIWPEIHAAHPEWTFTIVGSNPGERVLALRSEPQVEVTGTVPDMSPYYRDALAAVVPLRTGGGTRLKILEAFSAGVPVLSTSLGAEGLPVYSGRDLLVADDDAAWAHGLALLARDQTSWNNLAAAGRALARSRYDWEALGARLYQTYCDWLAADGERGPAR